MVVSGSSEQLICVQSIGVEGEGGMSREIDADK
jgi:hypothetical protein